MKEKLQILKNIIKKETGYDVSQPNRKRETTYARAVYCKLARGLRGPDDNLLSYSYIGRSINKDHASVLHNVRTIFRYAITDDKYLRVYNKLNVIINTPDWENKSDDIYSDIHAVFDRLAKVEKKNAELKFKISELKTSINGSILSQIESFSDEHKKEAYDRIDLMLRSIKSRKYS